MSFIKSLTHISQILMGLFLIVFKKVSISVGPYSIVLQILYVTAGCRRKAVREAGVAGNVPFQYMCLPA